MNTPTRRSLVLSAGAAFATAPLGAAYQVKTLGKTLCQEPVGYETRAAYFAALARGDEAAVRKLLDAHAGLRDATDAAGRSGFAVALLAGHDALGALLRERGYAPDLIERALAGELEEVVAEAGGDLARLARPHPVGGNAIWAAARGGRPNIWRLQSAGLKPNESALGENGTTAVRAAFDCPDPLRAWQTAIDLLGNAGLPNAPQPGGDSILHAAARRNDERLVRLALRKHADPTAENAAGETPLALARRLGRGAAAAVLADPSTIARDHRSSRFAYDASGAVWKAPELPETDREAQFRTVGLSHGNIDAVKALVAEDPRRSCSISTQDEGAVEAGAHMGRKDIVELHLDNGAPLSLPTAFVRGDIARAKALLEEDPLRVHERGAHDFAVMWYPLIGRCGVEGLELLFAHGAPVDQASYGTTALHWAAMRDDIDAARLLIAKGADVNAVGYKFGRQMQTPLGNALARDASELAALLREHGAKE